MAGYTLIDHGLAPFSSAQDIIAWLEKLSAMRDRSPDDHGIAFALEEVKRLADLAGVSLNSSESEAAPTRAPR